MDKIKLPAQRISAQFAAAEADKETRTVPMVFYTGSKVMQFTWEKGAHYLTLSMDPKAVRLGILNSGNAPFTKGHGSSDDPMAVIGIIANARLEGKEGRAEVRFSRNHPDGERLFNDVMDGILTNVSVEANIYKLRETTQENEKIRSFVAEDWEPVCVALVAQGADPNAHINAAAADQVTECEIEFAARATSPKEQTMEKPIENAGDQARAVDEAKLAAQAAERNRVLGITKLGQKYGLAELAAEHVESGSSEDQFRAAALDAIAAREQATDTRNHVSLTRDQRDTLRAGIPQAIMAVQGLASIKENDPGYEYRALAARGPLAIAEECVMAMGHNTRRMSRDEIVRLAMVSTSDLPLILGATADSALRAGYAADPKINQWEVLAARRVVSNFRPQYDLMASVTANFPQVPESGEYKVATLTEGRETYRLYTYGNKLLITRQTMINDTLGALTDVPYQMGAESAQAKATLFWNWVIANGNLSDGAAVFVAGHSNLIDPGTAISVDNLGIARKTLALQKNQAGRIVGLSPQYMVVPAAKEQLARQYLSNAYNPAQPTSINPWAGLAQLLVEPKLDASSATAWYLFANPSIAPVFVQVYLAGNEGVFSQAETTVDIDGFKWLMRFDFGVGSVDYRGAVKNLGA